MANEGYAFDPTSLSDKDLQDYINYYNASANRGDYAGNPNALKNAQSTQNMLNQLKQEQTSRQNKVTQQDNEAKYRDLIGGSQAGGGGGVPQAPAFDYQAYLNDLNQSAGNQRTAIGDIFKNAQEQGVQGINDAAIAPRQQYIDEQAALGNLRNPNVQGYLANTLDANKNKSIGQLIANVQGQKGQALSGVEQQLGQQAQQGREFGANLANTQNQFGQNLAFQKGSSLANLIQGNQQQNQNYGLQRDIFNAGQGQNSLSNLLGNMQLDYASEVGKQQAKQKEPGFLDYLTAGTGLLGGIGGAVGGVSNAFNAFSKNNASFKTK